MAVKWEYKVGPITANFRVLLEPKGFLRIIMVVIAILAFSLTAGFTDSVNDNSLSCTSSDNVSRTVKLEFSYPFRANNFKADYSPSDDFITNSTRNTSSCQTSRGFENKNFAGFAQFFVAMGVLTFLYCLGALVIYVIFINPELPFAKWIIIADFIASIIFAFLYLLADIIWSAGIANMDDYLETELFRRGRRCLLCDDISSGSVDSGLYGQPAISVVFGWLLCFIWFASLWFTYKDTFWHKDSTGPLSENYSPDGTAESQEASSGPPAAPPAERVTGEY